MGFRWKIFFALFLIHSLSYGEETISAKDPRYLDAANSVFRALTLSSDSLRVNSNEIPVTTKEARALFEKVCTPTIRNFAYSKVLQIESSDEITQYNFQCETKGDFSSLKQNIQFIASLDRYEQLADLQILQVGSAPNTRSTIIEDSGEILVAVAVGTLASGLLAKGLYPHQNDKILHAVAGSLIAASSALVAYYGFHLSENQAFWVGLATGVLAGILKEVYDSHHSGHTVDDRDSHATAIGGLMGSFFIRLKFEF